MFRAIQLEGPGLTSSADTFSTCFGSSSWWVHEICSSSVGGLAYLHFHLYNQTTNPTDRCCFQYLANFMSTVVVLGPISVPSISSNEESNWQLFLFIPTDISDHRFSGGRAQNWPSIVSCVTNSTQNSMIYNWEVDLWTGRIDIALLLFCVLQIVLQVPRYTNSHTECKAGGVKIAIVYGY